MFLAAVFRSAVDHCHSCQECKIIAAGRVACAHFGVQALRSAVRAHDGRGEPSALLDVVMAQLGLGDLNDIMHRLYSTGMSRSEIAALAPRSS